MSVWRDPRIACSTLIRDTVKSRDRLTHSMRMSRYRYDCSISYVSVLSTRKMARVLSLFASGSRKKSEYEDIVDVDDEDEPDDEPDESGDEEGNSGEDVFCWGNSTAMVPP